LLSEVLQILRFKPNHSKDLSYQFFLVELYSLLWMRLLFQKSIFFLVLIFIFHAFSPYSTRAAKPEAAVAPIISITELSKVKRNIIFNLFRTILADDYQLLSRQDILKTVKEIEKKEGLECIDEYCLRKIRKSLKTGRLFTLTLVQDEDIIQFTLRLIRKKDTLQEVEMCEGCNTRQLFAKVRLATQKIIDRDLESPGKEKKEIPATYVLNLKLNPPDASVDFVEKDLDFEQGMLLFPGSYQIEVSRQGYETKKVTLEITGADVSQTINLEKLFEREPPRGMVRISAGKFLMGNQQGEDDEKPVHSVYLKKYFLDQYEVTVQDYQKCLDAGVCDKPHIGRQCNWKEKGREKHPINCVDWYQAKKYCKWNKKRLPTEAEWEKAASWRAGSEKEGIKYKYPSRKRIISCENAVMDATGDGCGKGRTWPVGSKPKEINGTYDMAGNVWEWVADRFGNYSSKKQKNPGGPSRGFFRVYRGGSWLTDYPSGLQSTTRNWINPTTYKSSLGFRCATSYR